MTHNDDRIPFDNNNDDNGSDNENNKNDDNNQNIIIIEGSAGGDSSNNYNQNTFNGGEYSDEYDEDHDISNRPDESEFSDIRLSASNNNYKTVVNSNNKSYGSKQDNSGGDIELDDLKSGAIINNNNNNNSNSNNYQDDNNDDSSEGEKQVMIKDVDDDDNSDGKSNNEDIDDEPAQPIPRHIWIRILLIYYAVFSDGLSLTLIQPFLPQILTERWGFASEDVGYISGILVGVYSFARFGSGFYLGHFSDKYGRKWFLVGSLFFTGIGTILFALMPNVWLAVGLRIIEGLFSNTTALCQATLADMVDKKNRAAIFAYLGGTYALSRCISSSMGGFVVKIFEKTDNPYLYPCVVGGAIVLLSALLIMIIHPETHPKFTKLDYGHHNYKNINQASEELEKSNDTSSNKPTTAIATAQVKKDKTFKEGMTIILKDRGLLLLMVVGGLNSFNNGGLLLSLVLFSSLEIDKRGLGFHSMESGIIFTILGFFGFLWQVLLFKKVSGRFGLKKQYTVGMILLSVGMALFPLSYVAWYIQGYPLVWVTIAIVVPIISVGFMSGLPIVQGMVANCSNPEIQGLTQGSTQSINSMLRSFGPAISGAIFSMSSKYGAPWVLFIILSIIYVCVSVISLYLPDKVDINHKALKKKSEQRNKQIK